MDDPKQELPDGIDKRTFTVVKKGGFDQREVKTYLEDLEQAFRDLELWAQRTKDRLVLAELEVERAKHAENAAVENAMSAVFDAKDRILQRAHDEAGRIEARALGGEGPSGSFSPLAGDEAERLRSQAEQLLADAERRADAMIAAAELRLTDARKKSADAEQALREAHEAAGAVSAEDSTWAGAAQQETIDDLRRRLRVTQERVTELETTKTPDQVAIDRANEEAEAIIAAAQHRSTELLQQSQAAMTMPGGEAIAAAEERAASIIAEAEARARQIEEAVHGIKSQAESEVQSVRDEADRLQAEADRARADASAAAGRLAAAEASFHTAKAEADDLRGQLAKARSEISDIRTEASRHEAPSHPPAPPVTALDAEGGIVSPATSAGDIHEPARRRALEVVPEVEEPVVLEAVTEPIEAIEVEATPVVAEPVAEAPAESEPTPTERPTPAPAASTIDYDEGFGDGPSASERLRMAAQKMRRESGIEDGDAPMAGRGSRYERRSAGLPRIGKQTDYGGLRRSLSGEGRSSEDDKDDEDD